MTSFIRDYLTYVEPKLAAYQKDPNKVLELTKEVQAKMGKKDRPFAEIVPALCTMVEMLSLSAKRTYRKLPFKTVSSLVLACLYFVLPVDMIPDFIALFGWTDDVAVVLFVWKSIAKDVASFEQWKAAQSKEKTEEDRKEKT